ncbi:uncharacterized protein LOC113679533 [Pocillopora damicornis]|uniref:uncharacterized protein LOC113679533 n=1 Tax=Pocillopora damicornis TaxID=46731 RepID=UPI000F553447|nr:uncharacterized protein LOC113679533 [Pocillopora damicornis]
MKNSNLKGPTNSKAATSTTRTEKDNKLAFLDNAVLREPEGRLTTCVYRKPTHTDQYLANLPRPEKPNNIGEPANEFKATAVLPYVKGLSEQLRRCLQQQGVRAIFKSETTLRSQLVRPKDAVDPAKQDGVVYRIPCECSKVYIGETGRPLQDRIKEHDRDIRLAVPRPPPFQSMPTTPDTSHSGTK